MASERGPAFLLKVGDGKVFDTVAGLRATNLLIEDKSVSVTGSGIFLDHESETRVRTNALAGTLDHYELSFEDGKRMRGQFLVQRLDYVGDFNGERTYSVSLESSGEVVPA